MDKDQAVTIAEQAVAQISDGCGVKLVLLNQHTAAAPEGWVFFYQSEEFVRTGNLGLMLAGNGPMYVQRDGSVRQLLASEPWQDQVQR